MTDRNTLSVQELVQTAGKLGDANADVERQVAPADSNHPGQATVPGLSAKSDQAATGAGGRLRIKKASRGPSSASMAGEQKIATTGNPKPATSGNTRTELALKALRRKRGSSVPELQDITGWQAHSVRGFLSGTVKKKLELPLTSEVGKDAVRRYRVADDTPSN